MSLHALHLIVNQEKYELEQVLMDNNFDGEGPITCMLYLYSSATEYIFV